MGADKSLARPWKETSYSEQTYKTIPKLMAYKQQEYIVVVCMPYKQQYILVCTP